MTPQCFGLEHFLSRSTDATFEESTFAKTLDGLPPLSPDGPWLAGGSIRRILMGQEPDSDFDFFFANSEQLEEFKTELLVLGLKQVRETEHHIHFRGIVGDIGIYQDVQLIRFAFYNDIKSVIDSFDFTICQFAFDGETVMCGEFALWDLGRKRLAVHKITYPVSTMRRVLKYTKQGFRACSGCLAAILKETANSPELLTQLDVEYVD